MTIPLPSYEILVRNAPDGTISGAHAVPWEIDGTNRDGTPRYAPGLPAPIDPAAVADVLGTQAAAMIGQIQDLTASLAERDAQIEELRGQVAAALEASARAVPLIAELEAAYAEINDLRAQLAEPAPEISGD